MKPLKPSKLEIAGKHLITSNYVKTILREAKQHGKLYRGTFKGSNGRALIIGGSENFVGCLAIAARAALSTGVDVVKIAAQEKIAWTLNTIDPSFITIKLQGKKQQVLKVLNEELQTADSLLIGTGWVLNNQNKNLLKHLIEQSLKHNKKLVLDAGAVRLLGSKSLAKLVKRLKPENCVVTPHASEFESFANIEVPRFNTNIVNKESFNTALQRADKALLVSNQVTVLLKGVIDVISFKNVFKLNTTGCAAMTVMGTGDVLAGLVTGLLARNLDGFQSAIVAAFINGFAGQELSRQGYFTAWELANNLKSIVKL
ncbi:NAD(P)H-hydrate dehydratase [Candidatus Woesearchaeota archaeon]|nr:NAD(P)H-hydrate dehydratase [Candidatus Woesearchaeota archaeon]